SVERAVRESVDDGDVQPLVVEKATEGVEIRAFEQLTGIASREPEADTERAIRRKALLERRGVAPQVRVDGRPAVGGMDVGAVGEVRTSAAVDLHGASACLCGCRLGHACRKPELGR